MNFISESRLRSIIRESINNLLLTESQESKSMHAAVQIVMREFGYDEEKARETVYELRNTISSLKQGKCGKFVEGVTRMYCDGQLRDTNTMSQLNATLKYVASDAHINEYRRDLNGMSAQDLIDRFAANIEMDLEYDKANLDKKNYTGVSDYDIVRIDSYEQATKYYEYTFPDSRWCLTYKESMFDTYTCGGINQIYFCLKKGFENVEAIPSEGCPLDEYGLSMISVIVNEKGALVHSTSRWNHKNGGSDDVMNTEQISDVIQMRFYDVFKPNNNWNEMVENAMESLANGEDPMYVFDNCGSFREDFARVMLNNRCNYINKNGQLLTYLPTASQSIKGKWFDICADFNYGFARVMLNNKLNLINSDGVLISPNQWFDECSEIMWPFKNLGFARVKLNGTMYRMDTEGNLYDIETKEPLGMNVKTMNRQNESIKDAFTKMIVENVMHQIRMQII